MSNYVIVGGGPAGLYTAYRLLQSGALAQGDTLQVYEWSNRPGGRIFTYTFPKPVGSNGLYCEFGGMRFATDDNFPNQAGIKEGHVLVQNMIIDMGLAEKVVPFLESSNRMYYLRGSNFYENSINQLQGLPYNFNSEFTTYITNKVQKPYTADNILGAIATEFAPNLGSTNADRDKWCHYYAKGYVDRSNETASFPAGTQIHTIGYWNLLYDQLGDEGFDYTADGTGYTSNVINWNSADAMQANNDYGSSVKYQRLDGGYSILFEAMAAKVAELAAQFPGSGIFYNQQCTALVECEADNSTICHFLDHSDPSSPTRYTVQADQLFLAMPRRSLEILSTGCPESHVLNNPKVKYFLESSIDQPAMKVVLVFDQAWWATSECQYPPNLVLPPNAPPDTPMSQAVGGATITDLPLRMVYYFANNIPGGPGLEGGPYVMLASYDDMNYSGFWRELEFSGDFKKAPSLVRQPLHGPTSVPVDSPLAGILVKQLAEAHGIDIANVPKPIGVYFQDWGQDPFGGGYHGWAAHYNICEAMDRIRAPYQKILNDSGRKTYIIGSCYSFDQAWVEGAFCTAESVLQDFLGLPPLNQYIAGYKLVCTI